MKKRNKNLVKTDKKIESDIYDRKKMCYNVISLSEFKFDGRIEADGGKGNGRFKEKSIAQ